MRRRTPVLIACLLPLLLCSCGNMFKAKGLAEPKVEEFHQLFNDGKFDPIYDRASAEFKSGSTKKELTDLLDAVRRKLGKVISTSNVNWKVNSHNLKTYVILTQATSFDHGTATETFTFVVEGGTAVLHGYHINSRDLIVK